MIRAPATAEHWTWMMFTRSGSPAHWPPTRPCMPACPRQSASDASGRIPFAPAKDRHPAADRHESDGAEVAEAGL